MIWAIGNHPILMSVWMFQLMQFRHMILTLLISALILMDLMAEYDRVKK